MQAVIFGSRRFPPAIANADRNRKPVIFQALEKPPQRLRRVGTFHAFRSVPMRSSERIASSRHSKEHIMASIVIKDLLENVELDRKAMVAVVGGARRSGGRSPVGVNLFRTNRIVSYPTGFVGRSLPERSKPE
jgi:hypothetical protein